MGRESATAARRLARSLVRLGVRHAFCVVGNQVNSIVRALADERIEVVACRHEGTAAQMAEAYARTSGVPGVCVVIPGPGVSNALTGLLEAHTACSPVLLLTVRQPTREREPEFSRLFHGLDHLAAAAPFTGYAGSVRSTAQLAEELDRAFRRLLAPRPRPVFLEFEMSVLDEPADEVPIPEVDHGPEPDREALAEAARRLAAARRPLVVVGRGVATAQAVPQLRALVDTLGAPVLTTTLGKGVVPESHPRHVGRLYEEEVRGLAAAADAVVAVGARFTQVDTDDGNVPLPGTLIRVEATAADAAPVAGYPADVSVVGDLRRSLPALRELLAARSAAGTDWPEEELHRIAAARARRVPRLVRELDALAEAGVVIAVDVHEQGYPTAEYLRVDDPARYLFSGISLNLGYGIPAAVGAQLARRGERVVAFCGDGGFLMSSAELATVVKYRLPIVFLVVNDDGYGTIRTKQCAAWGYSIGADLVNPDLVELAACYGIEGWRIESVEEIAAGLQKALAREQPVVLEIRKRLVTGAADGR